MWTNILLVYIFVFIIIYAYKCGELLDEASEYEINYGGHFVAFVIESTWESFVMTGFILGLLSPIYNVFQ